MNDEDRIPEAMFRRGRSDELIKEIMRPDLYKFYPTLLSKELKLSNIKREDLSDIDEETDLALQWMMLGGDEFSNFLIVKRDVKLSATSSVNGFERTAEITDIQKQEIKEEKQGIVSAPRLRQNPRP